MKAKCGVTGDVPEKDSFPFFKSTKKWTCLLWEGNPNDWRILSFEGERPENIYDTEEAFKASYVLLSKITEVYLEVGESVSFRVYQGNEVTRYTPQPESRSHAEAWVNAIYAAMQVQGMGTLPATTEGDMSDDVTPEFDDDLLELRQLYVQRLVEQEEQQNEEGGLDLAEGGWVQIHMLMYKPNNENLFAQWVKVATTTAWTSRAAARSSGGIPPPPT